MWEVEKNYAVKLGGNLFVNCETLVTYEGEPLFNVARRSNDLQLGIDFDVYDKDGSKLATVRRSSIVDGDSKRFVIEHSANVKTMTDKQTGKTLVRIDKRPFKIADFPTIQVFDIDMIRQQTGMDLQSSAVELDITLRTYLPDSFFLIADPETTNLPGNNIVGGNVMIGRRVGIKLTKDWIAI